MKAGTTSSAHMHRQMTASPYMLIRQLKFTSTHVQCQRTLSLTSGLGTGASGSISATGPLTKGVDTCNLCTGSFA